MVLTIWVSPLIFSIEQMSLGYYVWLSAFAVSGIGLVGSSVKPSAPTPDAKSESS
jgi:hypothetical protein